MPPMQETVNQNGGKSGSLGDGYDVVICGASFAGLAAARELTGCGASVLVLDRYDIGDRPTSACGIPTDWLRQLGMIDLELQRFDELVVHTPGRRTVLDLPYTFSTFNYDKMCEALWRECDAAFEVAKVDGRHREGDDFVVETDRGPVSAPLVVDAMGWRRILASGDGHQPPEAELTRALEVHPTGGSDDLEVWVNRRYAPAGYAWSFPAGEEVRVGVCSYRPPFHVRESTDLLATDLGHDQVRYQGNWIPHALRSSVEGGIFFAGDSAGHCLPLTAEGIRTALYFGIALGRELRAVVDGRRTRAQAIARYAEFGTTPTRGFRVLRFFQRLIPYIPERLLGPAFRVYSSQPLIDFTFNAYLRIAPPEFATASAPARATPAQAAVG